MDLNLEKLNEKLEAEGYNSQFYCIGSGWQALSNGHALDVVAGGFEFFYVERGQKSPLEFFANENDACRYAYNFLAGDKWSKSHLVGFYDSEEQADECASRLQAQEIEFKRDIIPYGNPNDVRHRVFVFGTDFQRVRKLRPNNF